MREATAASRPPLIELRRVTKRFPGVVANDDVSFAIHAGEVHVILGENGAGKSTLVGLLAGMQRPDAGEILVDGHPVAIDSPARALALGIGTVYQHVMLVPTLTVAANLELGGRWYRRPDWRATADRFRATCRAFGMTIAPEAITGRLSLGEQQQIEIIRALWRGSRLVVLDEPTAMLTPQATGELIAIMRRLRAEGYAVVFITHRLHEAIEAGDRITVLRRGRVAGGLGPEVLTTTGRATLQSRITELMFGEATAASPDRAARAAAPKSGAVVLAVRGLTVRARGRAPLLDGVQFEVRAGEVFGIAGVDGNGQRELAEALAGQIAADAGAVMLDGADLARFGVAARHRRGLRYVTDDRLHEGTVGSFPVGLNLVLKQIGTPPFWSGGVARRRAITAHADRLIDAFDVRTPSAQTPIGRLSGGNIQKALLARELHGAARLVIYSKPTAGLDLRNIAAARARIRAGVANGSGAIVISTELDELLDIADRIGVMLGGRLVGIVANGLDARGRVAALMTGAAPADADAA